MRSQFPSAFVALALLCTSLNAAAEPPRIHLTGAAVRALGGHQEHELGWGAAALPALEYPITRAFGLQLEMSALWLSEGSPPRDPNVEPQGDASAFGAMFGPRLRPFARAHDGTALSPAGFWLSGGLGVVTTNALWRPAADAQIGYDFLDQRGRTGLGPVIGYYHVFQPDKELRPDDASLLMLGVHALFDLSPTSPQRRDADGDGIYDDADRCPQVAEDRDDFQDDDGCPELDNDNDGIADAKDRCPNQPEDKDGFEDDDGCPDLDNDKDGIPDAKDKCPLAAEDRDGFEDEDGCPDPDNDKDGIPDVSDLCPFEPETVNDYADSDGCPDEDQVRVIGDQIVLDDRVHFWVNSHTIRRESFPLLQRLAKLIGDHPEYVRIDIAGHADERGPDSFNIPLSKNRARAVLDFLVKAGIAPERLNAEGFGEAKPLVDRKSEAAYYKNRRVEFIITRENRPGVAALPGTAPAAAPAAATPAASATQAAPAAAAPATAAQPAATQEPIDLDLEENTEVPPAAKAKPARTAKPKQPKAKAAPGGAAGGAGGTP